MGQDYDKEIEEIIGGLECPKDFQCCKPDIKALCKARDIGLETFLVCLEEQPLECVFALPFGGAYYCKCPLRVYIARRFKE